MSAAVVSYGFSADRGSEFMVWHEIRGLLTYTGRAPQQRFGALGVGPFQLARGVCCFEVGYILGWGFTGRGVWLVRNVETGQVEDAFLATVDPTWLDVATWVDLLGGEAVFEACQVAERVFLDGAGKWWNHAPVAVHEQVMNWPTAGVCALRLDPLPEAEDLEVWATMTLPGPAGAQAGTLPGRALTGLCLFPKDKDRKYLGVQLKARHNNEEVGQK